MPVSLPTARDAGTTSDPSRQGKSYVHAVAGTFAVLGEAPGKDEDRVGEPFVGIAGKLLRKTLGDVGLDHRSAYYMNAASCYPRGAPDQSHLDACLPNLRDQWDAIPAVRFVLVCGTIAFRSLMPRAEFKYAGNRPINIHGKTIFAVRHPAWVLRQHVTELAVWRKHLWDFKFTTLGDKGDLLLEPRTNCLYCAKPSGTRSNPEYPTCPQHTAKFRKDSIWRTIKPTQEEMFPDAP